MESTKKRTPHMTPTHRQLAYLDELKTHLLLMRQRQAIFMEQTAKMLTGISTVNMAGHEPKADGALPLTDVDGSEVMKSKSNPNIKQLIQRFEDLRQSSQKFTDLPDVPEELLNVDVRRILQGYEKLIEEGNIIQQSWLLLKNSTETCVRYATNTTFEYQPTPTPIPNLNQDKLGNTMVTDVAPKSSMQLIFQQVEDPIFQYPNAVNSAESFDDDWDLYEPKKDVKDSSAAKNRGHAKWGPFLRLIIRLLNPLHCGTKRSKKAAESSSSTTVAGVPPKKTRRQRLCQ
ncbi:hypothetical protein KR032_011886 [Drosophila birchii]|nr:hypothetical protein KR032_011886 [Drosophila birchii]